MFQAITDKSFKCAAASISPWQGHRLASPAAPRGPPGNSAYVWRDKQQLMGWGQACHGLFCCLLTFPFLTTRSPLMYPKTSVAFLAHSLYRHVHSTTTNTDMNWQRYAEQQHVYVSTCRTNRCVCVESLSSHNRGLYMRNEQKKEIYTAHLRALSADYGGPSTELTDKQCQINAPLPCFWCFHMHFHPSWTPNVEQNMHHLIYVSLMMDIIGSTGYVTSQTQVSGRWNAWCS